MKTFKLKGIDYYIVNVFSAEDAVLVALVNRIGITLENLELVDFSVDRDAGFAEVYRSYESLEPFIY